VAVRIRYRGMVYTVTMKSLQLDWCAQHDYKPRDDFELQASTNSDEKRDNAVGSFIVYPTDSELTSAGEFQDSGWCQSHFSALHRRSQLPAGIPERVADSRLRAPSRIGLPCSQQIEKIICFKFPTGLHHTKRMAKREDAPGIGVTGQRIGHPMISSDGRAHLGGAEWGNEST
jgi:hypothetical protein